MLVLRTTLTLLVGTVGRRDTVRLGVVSFAFKTIDLLGVVRFEVGVVVCLGLRCSVFGFRLVGLDGVDCGVTGARGEAFGAGIFDAPSPVEVVVARVEAVREDTVLEGALGIRLLALAGAGLAGAAELNTQAVFGGVFVPPDFDEADAREGVLLLEEDAISGSLGIGGAGLVGGPTLGPFPSRLILVAFAVPSPCPLAAIVLLTSPLD
jgi:hypothetical protein